MNTKRLITTSIFALISASAVQAADVMIPHQPTPVTSSTSAFVAPAFTWEGFYFGVQGGGFSSKTDMNIVGKHKTMPLSKDLSPKLSGFEGGLYAGANIDLGDNFVLGIDTDFTWFGQKHTKTITIGAPENSAVDNLLSRAGRSVRSAPEKSSSKVASTESAPAKQVSTPPATAKLASMASSSTNPTESAQKKSAGSTQTKQTKKEVGNTAGGTTQRSPTSTPAGSVSANPTGSTQAKPTSGGVVNARGTSPRSSTVTPSLTSATLTPAVSASTKPTSERGVNTGGASRSLTIPTSSVGRSTSSDTRSLSLTSSPVKKVEGLEKKAATVTSGTVGVQSGDTRQRVSLSTQATQSTGAQTGEKSGVTTSSSSVERSGESGVSAAAVKPGASPASATPTSAAPAVVSATPAKPEAPVGAAATPAAVSNLQETTVPKKPLLLARSGSSGSEVNAASGASGSGHGSGVRSHGTGTSPHGSHQHSSNSHAAHSRGSSPHGVQSTAGRGAQGLQEEQNTSNMYGIEQIKEMVSELGLDDNAAVGTLSHTLKQNWAGATRVRIGFAADRFMPYVAGGIAYTQLQDTVSVSVKRDDGTVVASKNLTDETKTMVGYTVGGGVDFAMLDNVILRAEYRYSDFGKKKFAKEKLEIKYTTNDFRVGVAYKF
ncbi:outer membrane beta-barrel protein [Bartonella sp. ML70XJBT.G]|uniref:outer membrane beta-barrel protein n=1 Tax=Bartonella sp. ML70XJBT.G TaxID=3019093 RepID=UPI002361F9A5|nr:outer membrane beta-barrel protein [Bartonella sp. ML70XJBT.G]